MRTPVAADPSVSGTTWIDRDAGVMAMAATMIAPAARCSNRMASPKKIAPIRRIVGSSAPPATAVRASPRDGATAPNTSIEASAQPIPMPSLAVRADPGEDVTEIVAAIRSLVVADR